MGCGRYELRPIQIRNLFESFHGVNELPYAIKFENFTDYVTIDHQTPPSQY